jgi:hypothetical protein
MPPPPEQPGSGMGNALLQDESIASLSSRLMAAENFLRLATRDFKFHDFAREILVTIMKVVKSEAGSLLEVDHRNNTLFSTRSSFARSSARAPIA